MIYLMTICCNYTRFTGVSWHFMGCSPELRLAYSSSWSVDWCPKFSQIILTSLERLNHLLQWSAGSELSNPRSLIFQRSPMPEFIRESAGSQPTVIFSRLWKKTGKTHAFRSSFLLFPNLYQKGAWKNLLFLLTQRENDTPGIIFCKQIHSHLT